MWRTQKFGKFVFIKLIKCYWYVSVFVWMLSYVAFCYESQCTDQPKITHWLLNNKCIYAAYYKIIVDTQLKKNCTTKTTTTIHTLFIFSGAQEVNTTQIYLIDSKWLSETDIIDTDTNHVNLKNTIEISWNSTLQILADIYRHW